MSVTTVVEAQGRAVLPAGVRAKLDLAPGSRLSVRVTVPDACAVPA